jgi:hypothetical protein
MACPAYVTEPCWRAGTFPRLANFPHDLGLDLRRLTSASVEAAAVAARDNALAPDDAGKPHDLLGDEVDARRSPRHA